jgi:hypothetical protein
MIHINYPAGRKPEASWVGRAEVLTEQLRLAADDAARHKIIDDNASLWGEVKSWLEEFSHGKCWFSEAKDTCSHWQVEHFRPKKTAKGIDGRGYWWLAFDYLNYRLCGGVVNAKKGSFFPLRAGTAAATCPGDNCDDEAPVLIDPTVPSDVMLLTFAEGGRAAPLYSDGWPHERASRSIERYKLNDHPAMLRARADVWNACQATAERFDELFARQLLKHSQSREQEMKDIASRFRERTSPSAPFSSVARAFLRQYPKAWASRLV